MPRITAIDLEGAVHTCRSMNPRTALITGASAGIGEATAKALAARGMRVVMLCRDALRCAAAMARIHASIPDARLVFQPVDLASLRSVRAAVGELRRLPRIDVLVLNAGTITRTRELTEDGFERTLAVDFLGSFALAVPLLDRLEASAPSRVVQLAGIYHRTGVLDMGDLHFERRRWSMRAANDQAQLARVVFVAELARRLDPSRVSVHAVHPGAVLTDAQKSAPAWARALIHTVARPAFVHADRGAEPVVRLALDAEVASSSGRFFDRREPAEAHPAASDPAIGLALWERACALTGIDRWRFPRR